MGQLVASVAVIIAAYRSEGWVARAVRSALAQPEAVEVVVVVDGSPDGTAAAARSADDGSGRLIVIACEKNRGPSAVRNLGIAQSSAAWIAIVDDDDFMEEGRIGRLLAGAGDCDCVADDLWLVREGYETGPRLAMASEAGHEIPQWLHLEAFVLGNIPAKPHHELGYLKPLLSRRFLDAHGLRYNESMRLGEDYDLYARALMAGARFRLVPPQGYVSVRRHNSLSAKHRTEDLLALRSANDRLLSSTGISRSERWALIKHRQHLDERYQWRRLIDAVKAGNVGGAARCFFSDHRTTVTLIGNLWGELRTRANGPGLTRGFSRGAAHQGSPAATPRPDPASGRPVP
jgi:succinoglycan biosynthesis protein ExoU